MDGTIAISYKKKVHILAFSDILHLESDGIYTTAYTKTNLRLICSQNIKVVLTTLCPNTFFRTHHSHAINLNEIKEYEKGRGGNVIMKDGSIVPIAKRRKSEFLKRIKK